MNFEELTREVIAWADNKGIFDSSNSTLQMTKTLEEIAETLQEIDAYKKLNATKADVSLEYGDILVTLIVGMHFLKIDPTKSLQRAFEKISARKGTMINGLFVKGKDDE